MKDLVSAAWIWLTVLALQMGLGAILLWDEVAPAGASSWSFASSGLTALALLLLARSLPVGVNRSWRLFAFWGGLQSVNLLETVFFDLAIEPSLLLRLFVHQLVTAGGAAWVVQRVAGPALEGPSAWPRPQPSRARWVRRALAVEALYVLVYLLAGMLIYPMVREFYESRTRPDPLAVLGVAAFRGVVFTGLVALVLRRLVGSRWRVAGVAAVSLGVLGGGASLLVPNPHLPDLVRLTHLVEILVSHAAFGGLSVWVLTRPVRRRVETPSPG